MGVPLVALGVRPPDIANPLDQYGKAVQLSSMIQQQKMIPGQLQAQQQQLQAGQQENQIRQTQINDQNAMTTAMHSWDGKDINDLPGLMVKHGASANAVMGMKNNIVTQRKAIAEADEATIKNQQSRNDLIAGHLEAVKGAADKQTAYDAALTDLEQKGLLKPGETPHQYPGDDQLALMEKQYMGGKQILEQGIKERETKAKESEAATRAAAAGNSAARLQAELPGGALRTEGLSQQDAWLARPENKGKDAADYVVWKAKHSPSAILQNPNISPNDPMVDMVGQGRVDLPTVLSRMAPQAKKDFLAQVAAKYPDYKQSTYGVEKGVETAFTSGQYSQQLNSINRAREHMGTFLDLAKNINNTDVKAVNRVKNAFQTQFGGAAPGNLQIAKQAFASEVGKSFAGANVALADRQELDHSIDSASSWEQLAGAAQTADTLLAGAQKALKTTYESGRQGKPNFGESNQTAGLSVKAPNGKTYSFKDQQSLDNFKKAAGIQ